MNYTAIWWQYPNGSHSVLESYSNQPPRSSCAIFFGIANLCGALNVFNLSSVMAHPNSTRRVDFTNIIYLEYGHPKIPVFKIHAYSFFSCKHWINWLIWSTKAIWKSDKNQITIHVNLRMRFNFTGPVPRYLVSHSIPYSNAPSLSLNYTPLGEGFYLKYVCRPFSYAHRHPVNIFLNKNMSVPMETISKCL